LANLSAAAPSSTPPLDPFAPPAASLDPTPSPADGAHEPADRFARFGANLLDWILLAPFAGIGCAIAGAINGAFNVSGDEAKGMYFIFGVMLALPFMIYQWYAVSTRGQTLGKRFCRIRIVRVDGSRLGFVHAVLLRSWVPMGVIVVISAVGLEPIARLLNFADTVSIFTGNRRMLHDVIAGTLVVNATPPTAPGA
jgi:uncharacterized RDD family membrane protein YckC